MPGGTLVNVYRPVSFVIVFRGVLVATSSRVTSAPGTTAPCGSVTCPTTVPVEVDCAQAVADKQTNNSPKQSKDLKVRFRFIGSSILQGPPLLVRFGSVGATTIAPPRRFVTKHIQCKELSVTKFTNFRKRTGENQC